VGVGVEGEGDVGVAESFGDDLWVDAGRKCQAGVGVPEVVEADAGQACALGPGSSVIRVLRRWLDKWRVRKYWKLRLAGPPLALAIVSWWYWVGGSLAVFAAAILITLMIDLPFRRSDQYAERIRKAREARRARTPVDSP
jgi:hypothetical protein